MFKDKTIVGVGCSHVYGVFLTENFWNDKESCWNRSWIKKLENLTEAKDSINLALPGGSNARSQRVIRNFVLDNLDSIENYVIFFGITELSRIELPIPKEILFLLTDGLPVDMSFDPENKKEYRVLAPGPFTISPKFASRTNGDKTLIRYLEEYYGKFHVDEYDIEKFNLDLISLHLFFTAFNIEHYFVTMLGYEGLFEKNPFRKKLPLFTFDGVDAISYARGLGYKVGQDYDPSAECFHLDDEGNQFLAEDILNKVKEWITKT